jgi:hypothetical protein
MTTGFVAEFSVYPALQGTRSFMDSYFTLFLIILVKRETGGRRIY